MIARVLSGGPVFVPRSARHEIEFAIRALGPAGYLNYVDCGKRLKAMVQPQRSKVEWPATTRTSSGFILRRKAPERPILKGAA